MTVVLSASLVLVTPPGTHTLDTGGERAADDGTEDGWEVTLDEGVEWIDVVCDSILVLLELFLDLFLFRWVPLLFLCPLLFSPRFVPGSLLEVSLILVLLSATVLWSLADAKGCGGGSILWECWVLPLLKIYGPWLEFFACHEWKGIYQFCASVYLAYTNSTGVFRILGFPMKLVIGENFSHF